jgi:succinate-acetate transporter protein
MIRNIKIGTSLIVIGLFTLVTTFPVTEGLVFFFTTLISMVLVLLGCLQFWIDRDVHVEGQPNNR